MRNHSTSIAALAVAGILASFSVQSAEDTATPSDLNSAMTDQDFLMTAGGSDEYERQAGRIAQQRGQHEEVRTLGEQLIEDHTRSTEMLSAAATAAGLTLPAPKLHPGLQRKLDELQSTPDALFDQVFLQQQAEAHVDARQLMNTCIEVCDAEQLRTTATDVLELVQAHLSHTLHLQRELEPAT